MKCNNCPRRCNIDRSTITGICGVSEEFKVARAGLHFGEEPCITGTKGSGTIFFSGCNLKCVFCQNYQISHDVYGKYIDKMHLIRIIKHLENSDAHNINFVTPTHYFSQISDTLSIYRPKIPVIYNSSGYDSVDNIEKNIFDIYLFDLKFFSREKSAKYANCLDYFEKASVAIKKASETVGPPVFDSNGILKRGVVVRHMILPSSTNDSIEIVKWLNDNTEHIIFSLMSQYVPMHKATDYKEINRCITKREYEKVLNFCYESKFTKTYIQELSSATTEFIPTFDLSGI